MGLITILAMALVQMIMLAGLIVLWRRTRRNHDEDARWSRNFQLLETKIAVFEDLSDRTEHQVKQLTEMMEMKVNELQRKIEDADIILGQISNSMKKSMEVAQIFQDQIPHEEILERQNTVKFVKAALMANEGCSVKEIAAVIDLPKAQIEFIVKVNAERLTFDVQQMPEWLKAELNKDNISRHALFENTQVKAQSPKGTTARPVMRPLSQVLKERSFLLEGVDLHASNVEPQSPAVSPVSFESKEVKKITPQPIVPRSLASSGASGSLEKKAKDLGIRPVIFPRIDG